MDGYVNLPNSPDFSIIENVWSILEQRITRRHYFDKASMKRALLEKWDEIPQKEINRLVQTTRTQPCARTSETRASCLKCLDIGPPPRR